MQHSSAFAAPSPCTPHLHIPQSQPHSILKPKTIPNPQSSPPQSHSLLSPPVSVPQFPPTPQSPGHSGTTATPLPTPPRVGRSEHGVGQPPPLGRSQRIFIKSLQNRIQNSGINNGYKGKLQSSCISSPGTYSKVLVGCRVFFFLFNSLVFLFPFIFIPQPAPSRGSGVQCVSPALAVFIHCKAEKIPPFPLKKKKLASQYKFLPSPTSG